MSTIVRWNPTFGLRPRRRAWNGNFGWMAPYWDSRVELPLDIEENEDSFVIKAELPGMDKKDISVDVKDRVLTLKGERRSENEVKEENYYRRERAYGKFQRAFTLPADIDPATQTFAPSVSAVKRSSQDLLIAANRSAWENRIMGSQGSFLRAFR